MHREQRLDRLRPPAASVPRSASASRRARLSTRQRLGHRRQRHRHAEPLLQPPAAAPSRPGCRGRGSPSGASGGTAPAGRRRMRPSSAASASRRRTSASASGAARSLARRSPAWPRARRGRTASKQGSASTGSAALRLAPGQLRQADHRRPGLEQRRQGGQRLLGRHRRGAEAALQDLRASPPSAASMPASAIGPQATTMAGRPSARRRRAIASTAALAAT